MKNKTRLILVGGFLGAGKTTLLYETTKRLVREGRKVGLITNDQASELVDTALLLQTEVKVAEVSGSCFCCNFNGLVDSIKQVDENSDADFIIAEPVGSCTDLSATLIQPLKELLSNELMVSPLTALADPFKLDDIINGGTAGLHPSAAYIFKKQLEESDFIVISKKDLLNESQLELLMQKATFHYPEARILSVSSKTGEGIAEWLNLILNTSITNQKFVDVDYDIYAEGEATLGWLNSSLLLEGENINWNEMAFHFLREFSRKTDLLNINIGHVKIILENGHEYTAGNITGTQETLTMRGDAGVSNEARLIVNARIQADPDTLSQLVEEALESAVEDKITMTVNTWKYLSPGYPKPTYRYKNPSND